MKRFWIVAFCLALTACGVPTQSAPHAVAQDDLPASLRSGQSTTTVPARATSTVPVAVYWIRNERITPSLASVPPPADLESVLALLERGPDRAETAGGARSALTGTDVIRAAKTQNGAALVDLDASFADAPQSDQRFALAQIVLTATARADVSKVRFTIDGTSTQVPRSDGSLTTGALSAADFRNLLGS